MNKSEIRKKQRIEVKRWFREEFLPTQKCRDCSENHPACIDFHHLDPSAKDSAVSRMLHDTRSKNTLIKELEKCVALCSNCHRKLHYAEMQADEAP